MENKRNQSNSKIPEIGTKEFNYLANIYFGGKPNDILLTNRELAIKWWKNQSNLLNRIALFNKYFSNTSVKDKIFTVANNYKELTGREIEEIWKNETQELVYENQNLSEEAVYTTKSNQIEDRVFEERTLEDNQNFLEKVNSKQFTQFSEELFLKYINKFSNKDKLKALHVISKEIGFDKYLTNLPKIQ